MNNNKKRISELRRGIDRNLDFNKKSFYTDENKSRSFSDKKNDDPWI